MDRGLERAIQGLVLAVLIVGPLATGAVRPQDFVVLQALTALSLVLWAGRLTFCRSASVHAVPAGMVVLLGLAYAIVSASRAELPYIAERELARVIVYASLFLLIVNHARSTDTLRRLVVVLATLGTVIAAYAIFQYATGTDRVWMFIRPPSYEGRASGTYICPNHLAGFLAAVLPLVAALVIGGRTSPAGRVMLGYSGLVMLAGLGVSLSRGGWLAAGAGLAGLAALHLWHRQHVVRIWVLIGLMLVAVGIIGTRSWVARDRVGQLFGDLQPGNPAEVRWSLWNSSVRMWKDHLWLGVGPGHFDYRFPAYREPAVQARPGYSHNDYLNTLADWGLVGFALVSGFVALTVIRGIRLLRSFRRDPESVSTGASDRWSLTAGALAACAALLTHALMDFSLQVPANAILAVVMAAMIQAQTSPGGRRRRGHQSVQLRLLAALLAVAAAAWLGWQGWRVVAESRPLIEAQRERRLTPRRLEALQRAWAQRPDNFETAFTLGETYRQLSFRGEDDYAALAEEAIRWYAIAGALNPYDSYSPARTAICLGWLGRHDEAVPFFDRALALDPNNHHLCILRGWHALQLGDYRQARDWYRRSLFLLYWPNDLGWRNFQRATRLLQEQRRQEAAQRAPP